MLDFQYSFATKLIFGKHALEKLPNEISQLNFHRLLLVYGKNSIKKNGIYQQLIQKIQLSNINIIEYPGCMENPDVNYVDRGAEIAKAHAVDFILAVGGGSVIDAGKAIALLASNTAHSIWQYKDERESFVNPAIPLGVVLTTAGTGSEVNGGFVIDNKESGEKIGFTNFSTRPVFACCNPEFTYHLSPETTRNNIVDILSHLLEQYFSNDDELFYVDDLLIASISSVLNGADSVLAEPNSYKPRANMMLASSFALSYLFSIGKEIHWSLHHLAHVLSSLTGATHGSALAMLLPGWLHYLAASENYRARSAHLLDRLSTESSKTLAKLFADFIEQLDMNLDHSIVGENKQQIIHKIMQNQGFTQRSKLKEEDLLLMLSVSVR